MTNRLTENERHFCWVDEHSKALDFTAGDQYLDSANFDEVQILCQEIYLLPQSLGTQFYWALEHDLAISLGIGGCIRVITKLLEEPDD